MNDRPKEIPQAGEVRHNGGTAYIVSSRFNKRAKADMDDKVKRLVLSGSGQ